MDLEDLLSGIAVVIDDRIDADASDGEDEDDLIIEIVRRLEEEWNLPCYKARRMPPERMWPSLLRAASFVLLDWKLWPNGAAELKQVGIEKNVKFLKRAKDYFVPVFIFTNEDPMDVIEELPESIYDEETADKSFVLIRRKKDLLSDGSLRFEIERWMKGNASVYALKVWNRALHTARKDLFGSMYARSADWPKVFWKAYKEDGVDPGSSLTHLINDNLRGRMRTGSFESEILAVPDANVSGEDLRMLISEASIQPPDALPMNEIGCGDLFKVSKDKFMLNLRPDCDCVPRGESDVDLYCIAGKRMRDAELREQYQGGHFNEKVWESVAFSVYRGKSVRFDFRKFSVEKYSCWREKRVGRLLHPYLTRLQQRYALFLQRQGLPRIPDGAIPEPRPSRATEAPDAETADR